MPSRDEFQPRRARPLLDPVQEEIDNLKERKDFVHSENALPTVSEFYRGKFIVVRGASGFADSLYVALKAAGGSYGWRLIISG